MKTAFNNNIGLFIGICFALFLSIAYVPFASAEAIEHLQKNASNTYERMMQAKQSAETLAKDAAFAEKKVTSIKQKLSAAEEEAAIARIKAEKARTLLEQATNQWKQATEALASEWGKTERK